MKKRSSVGIILSVALAGAVVLLVAVVGMHKMQQRAVEQEVRAALANDDRMARIQTFARLRDARGSDILPALVQALDDPDSKTHSRAGSALGLFMNRVGEMAPALAEHLKTSPYPEVRLSCAIVLMSTKSPVTHAAYLHALHDSFDKVVSIACTEMPDNAEKGDAEALYSILNHPSWRVRLEVCKALIRNKQADNRVVSTLESMSQDPEATNYDTEIDDFDKIAKDLGDSGEPLKHWGKLSTILQQARDIAAKK